MALACIFKGHDWAEWEYTSPTGCESIRVCKRDGAKESKTEHSFGEAFYVAEAGCSQKKKCARCGLEQVTGLVHHWGEWQAGASPCFQERVCARCKHKDNKETHQYRPSGPKRMVETRLGSMVVPHAVTPYQCTVCGKNHLEASVD